MRGNGLEASSYVAIADLDPRVADNMLEVLREAGVAAYAEPCLPQQGLLLEVTLPPAPLDRLHVDREEALRARELLKRLLARDADDSEDSEDSEDSADQEDSEDADEPRAASSDDDQVWAQIVQAYEADSKDPVAPWPTVEDADDAETDETGAVKTKDRPEPEDGDEESEPATAAADQDRYIPPPPPPLPKVDPITKLCWGITLAGPVLMLLAAFAGAYVPSWFMPLGVVAFVGGFVLLVFRMRSGPPDETDDGAVV